MSRQGLESRFFFASRAMESADNYGSQLFVGRMQMERDGFLEAETEYVGSIFTLGDRTAALVIQILCCLLQWSLQYKRQLLLVRTLSLDSPTKNGQDLFKKVRPSPVSTEHKREVPPECVRKKRRMKNKERS